MCCVCRGLLLGGIGPKLCVVSYRTFLAGSRRVIKFWDLLVALPAACNGNGQSYRVPVECAGPSDSG